MKQFGIAIFILMHPFLMNAQKDTSYNKVELNNKKIEELSNRINSLMDTLEASSSVEIKLLEYNQMKESNQQMRDSIKMLLSNLEQLNNKNSEQLELKDEYFIVVSSVKTREGIEQEKMKLSRYFDSLKIVQNLQQSWYYLLLPKTYDYSMAATKMEELRKQNIKDVWFIHKRSVIFQSYTIQGNSSSAPI